MENVFMFHELRKFGCKESCAYTQPGNCFDQIHRAEKLTLARFSSIRGAYKTSTRHAQNTPKFPHVTHKISQNFATSHDIKVRINSRYLKLLSLARHADLNLELDLRSLIESYDIRDIIFVIAIFKCKTHI